MFDKANDYLPYLTQVAIAIAIFVVGWMLSKWVALMVKGICRNSNTDEALGRFLGNLAQYGVMIATVISSLGTVGVQTTSLVAIFASAGLAIGLALQGNLANFASGVMILGFRPVRLGDWVTVGGVSGTVTDIGIFATTLLTANNEKLIVPNSSVTGGIITNSTVMGTLRTSVTVNLAAGTDVAKTIELLTAAAKNTELVLAEPEPSVKFTGGVGGAPELTVFAHSDSTERVAMTHNLCLSIHEALIGAGIQPALPQMVMHQKTADKSV